ncbi:hypothetical protein [Sphingomonas sp. PvP018]|uniref:hypothetical protein n=1 Tax=Sphingomonas sp. PvP018 TaxID=2817852 RepID=UPI001AE411BD|nr:hypothetical protein [Sphingomonas sp. PvP018]MBP2513806.1 hypothetical protein [Sphingomonas sp. PvP018]
MSDDAIHELLGFVDPSGLGMGFLVPIFRSLTTNAPDVQLIDAEGLIAGFEPYEAPEPSIIQGPSISRTIGDPAVAAFSFSTGDVVVDADQAGRDLLASRFDDPKLAGRPTVAMELATHLRRPDLRIGKAREAHDRMARTSRKVADDWRDLGILTTEVRRAFSAATGDDAAAADLVVRIRMDVVEILGLDPGASGSRRASVITACEQALDLLAPIVPRPAAGWRFGWPPPPRRLRGDVDADVLLASERAKRIFARDAPLAIPSLRLFDLDHPAATDRRQDPSVPTFVVRDTVSRRSPIPPGSHAIDLGVPKRRSRDAVTGGVTLVPTNGMGSGKSADRHQLAGVRLAIAAELDRRRADISPTADRTLILRARGNGPLATDQALATLYDKAWAFGLAPWRSLLIAPTGGSDDDDGPRGVAEVLFAGSRRLKGELCDDLLAASNGTLAILVDDEPREPADEERNRIALAFLLERQGWVVDRGPDLPPDVMTVRGGHWTFELRTTPGSSADETESTYPPDVELGELRRLVVTSNATAASILKRLRQEPTLEVNVRDLVALRADEATPLTLVAAHLSRMVTALKSRSRGQYLGMVTREALRSGGEDAFGTRALADLLGRPGIGSDVQLSLRSATMKGGALFAEVRVSRDDSSQDDPIGSYRLIVEPKAVHVTGIALPGAS